MCFLRGLPAALAAIFVAGAVAADQIGDRDAGEKVFSKCKGCHEVGQGARDRIGPHLNGIFGRAAAAHADYAYSKSMTRAGQDGLVWTIETLDAYIENPRALVSKTRMSFRGVKDPKDRADVLAYLRGFSDNPSDVPEAEPTARATDHDLDPAILALKGDAEYGEYLSSECLTCHQSDGSADGIPSITRWPTDDFVVAMHAYKRKLRPHPVMQMMAERLSDEEIAALAAYFKDLE
ncbi:c-type cytochrome [Roseobacter sp. YSTF-M11]|uniref:C-type cytochrome n=1 Tax=Roseobacter insulae TaxID=2859783 RepID=A0A9X1FWN9_9RHOB|nr:c-type cytochrome [Roseobacter insulae]MBW4709149.1 c-type cytochrome [Roseobacter insulae]